MTCQRETGRDADAQPCSLWDCRELFDWQLLAHSRPLVVRPLACLLAIRHCIQLLMQLQQRSVAACLPQKALQTESTRAAAVC